VREGFLLWRSESGSAPEHELGRWSTHAPFRSNSASGRRVAGFAGAQRDKSTLKTKRYQNFMHSRPFMVGNGF
jgi:hypothetical protein